MEQIFIDEITTLYQTNLLHFKILLNINLRFTMILNIYIIENSFAQIYHTL